MGPALHLGTLAGHEPSRYDPRYAQAGAQRRATRDSGDLGGGGGECLFNRCRSTALAGPYQGRVTSSGVVHPLWQPCPVPCRPCSKVQARTCRHTDSRETLLAVSLPLPCWLRGGVPKRNGWHWGCRDLRCRGVLQRCVSLARWVHLLVRSNGWLRKIALSVSVWALPVSVPRDVLSAVAHAVAHALAGCRLCSVAAFRGPPSVARPPWLSPRSSTKASLSPGMAPTCLFSIRSVPTPAPFVERVPTLKPRALSMDFIVRVRASLPDSRVRHARLLALLACCQHACDEKFRFETLQRETTIHEQQLVCPRAIEVRGRSRWSSGADGRLAHALHASRCALQRAPPRAADQAPLPRMWLLTHTRILGLARVHFTGGS